MNLRARPRAAIAAAAAAVMMTPALMMTSSPATGATEDTVISGHLADSTPYRFLVPDDWNGTVFVDMDFAGSAEPSPTAQRLVDEGAAYGGTTRAVTGWNIPAAIANQVEALDRFEETAGEADRRITMGSSMGGFVAAGVAQHHPDAIDGVVSMCGGLSGTVSQWNQKLDTVFVLSTLLDPAGTLPVVGIPEDVPGSVAAWQQRLAEAQETPEGRARIALAATIGQLPAWSESAPRPTPRDTDAYQRGWYGALAADSLPYIGQAMSSRRTFETLLGGNPSWNTGVDYAEQLATASPAARHVVDRLYREAGLSLEDDVATVDRAPRISADPDAVKQFELGTEFDGRISVPVVTMSNIGDQISTVAQQSEYQDEVDRAGNSHLLRQTYVEAPTHCGFSDAERVAAAHLLLHRLDTGGWHGRETPPRMNQVAESLDLGPARFIPFRPDAFNRPYSPSWG